MTKSVSLNIVLLLAMTLVFGAPHAIASHFDAGKTSHLAIASIGTTQHLASGGGNLNDLLSWLKGTLIKYLGNGGYGGTNPFPAKGSVPIPGTLLPFGMGLGALVLWSRRRFRP
jgi:hypothetical protein